MKGSLTILFFFCAGLALARLGLMPDYLLHHDLTLYALWLLMFLVGLSIGSDRRLQEILRSLRPRVLLLLPLATTVGSFAGAALASVFLIYSVSECMAVGAGFAYYSLSSIFISQYKGPELGTIALISNIGRELGTLLLAPLLAKISPLAPIVCGGASTMDTTLPVITRYSGREWLFTSIVHGMVLDFTVPFWVIFFCTL